MIASILVLAALGNPLWAGDGKPKVFTFGKDAEGKVPAGWKAGQTGKGKGSVWTVVADETAPSKMGKVLAQTAASPKAMFNLCVAEGIKAKDVEISVSFKAIKGEVDQGGGILWRYQDANNYSIARMNPLEDNYRLYKVVGGKRIQLETAEKLKVPVGTWHKLTIRQVGKKIECFLDGKKVMEAEDEAIQAEGKTGLWTKADAQTQFDLFSVQGLSRRDN